MYCLSLWENHESHMTRITFILYMGLISYKALARELLKCLAALTVHGPLPRFWFVSLQFPKSGYDLVSSQVSEITSLCWRGEQVCKSNVILFVFFKSQSQSTALPAVHQTLWSLDIGIFPIHIIYLFKMGTVYGVSWSSTATLRPSWCSSPLVPHLGASHSGLLVLHLFGKLLSFVWWGSKNAEGLEQVPLSKGKIMMDLSRRPCCCLSHDCSLMMDMT